MRCGVISGLFLSGRGGGWLTSVIHLLRTSDNDTQVLPSPGERWESTIKYPTNRFLTNSYLLTINIHLIELGPVWPWVTEPSKNRMNLGRNSSAQFHWDVPACTWQHWGMTGITIQYGRPFAQEPLKEPYAVTYTRSDCCVRGRKLPECTGAAYLQCRVNVTDDRICKDTQGQSTRGAPEYCHVSWCKDWLG
jgi:hypothetical protein